MVDGVGQDATAFLSTPPSSKLPCSLPLQSLKPVSFNGRELLSTPSEVVLQPILPLYILLEQGMV
jgi:hypothetical protein